MLNVRNSRAVLLLLFSTASVLLGQNAPTLRQGNTEIGLFAGGGYGLNVTGTSNGSTFSESATNWHVMGGGDVGYAVTKSVFLVGEASYFPSLSPAASKGAPACPPGVSTPGTSDSPCHQTVLSFERRVFEFNGGVHLRLPVPESRFVPYLAGGIGAARFLSSTVTSSSVNLVTNAATQGQSGTAAGATAFEVAAGAGARLYLSEHFGFRGEFRLYHPFGIQNLGSFYRATGGIFFQLK
jgi:Outer membrane protein beta-barrel domain